MKLTLEEESRGGVVVVKVEPNRLKVGRRAVENKVINLSMMTS
jgi:hypothetical protein